MSQVSHNTDETLYKYLTRNYLQRKFCPTSKLIAPREISILNCSQSFLSLQLEDLRVNQ